MKVSALIVASALALSTSALAQDTPAPAAEGAPAAGETSDRTPDKSTQTPQSQEDTAGGKTSDRSQDKDVKVEHQPGAAGHRWTHLRAGGCRGDPRGEALDAPEQDEEAEDRPAPTWRALSPACGQTGRAARAGCAGSHLDPEARRCAHPSVGPSTSPPSASCGLALRLVHPPRS